MSWLIISAALRIERRYDVAPHELARFTSRCPHFLFKRGVRLMTATGRYSPLKGCRLGLTLPGLLPDRTIQGMTDPEKPETLSAHSLCLSLFITLEL